MVERGGYKATAALNGLEALRAYRTQPADLVITDIFMPDMDGLEVIKELQRHFENPRFIAISGGHPRVNMDLLPVAQSLGARRILYKPIKKEELLDAIESALEN